MKNSMVTIYKQKLELMKQYHQLTEKLFHESDASWESILDSREQLIGKITELDQGVTFEESSLDEVVIIEEAIRCVVLATQKLEEQFYQRLDKEQQELLLSMRKNNNSPKIQAYVSMSDPQLDTGSLFNQDM